MIFVGEPGQESSAAKWLSEWENSNIVRKISVSEAAMTPGAILVTRSGGHVAISIGDGSHVIDANVDFTSRNDGSGLLDFIDDVTDTTHPGRLSDLPMGVDIGDVRQRLFSFSSHDADYVALTVNL
jgi:hypothetical protein